MMDFSSASAHLKQMLLQPPSKSSEEWKYADFQFLQKYSYSLFSSDVENTVEMVPEEKKVIITVRAPLSNQWKVSQLPEGMELKTTSQKQTWTYKNFFSNLSEGFSAPKTEFIFHPQWNPELLVDVVWNPRETMASGTQFIHKNLSFLIKPGAEVFFFERSFLNQKQFINIDAEYFLEEGAQLNIFKAEKGQMDGRGCQTSRFRLGARAQLQIVTTTAGADWSRHNVYAELIGENASAQMLAASISQNKEYIDHQTWVDHKVGHTSSMQRYVSVLGDEAHGVFNGRVYIHPDAQKSSAEQTSRNLLLSKKARVDTKPELLIEADDVKAKHGATVGQLNPDELFYLLSRGIDREKAQQMLVKGFVNDIADRIPQRFQELFYKEIAPSSDFLAEGV
jgi:FeS assembly protein SufD